MIWVFLIFQAMAVAALMLWWHWWSGRTTVWLEGRRRGWFCFLFLTAFVAFQGLALTLVSIPDGDRTPPIDSDPLRLLAMSLLFLGTPIGVLFTALWAPRFVLPGWIRERLAAGDPVRTAQPAPEVQHLMTHPQNAPVPEPTHEQLQLPTEIRVGVGRWWFGAVVCAVCAAVFTAVALGGRITAESVVFLLLAAASGWGAVVFGRSALRPEHLRITERGIQARSWSLAWEEVTGVEVTGDPGSHKGQVFLLVSATAHERVKGMPWTGGSAQRRTSPGGPDRYRVGLQPGTQAPPAQIADLVSSVLRGRGPG